uniref:Uncharacterized protein n=1 Tax=Anguilla anguilla TaxID=7936 RepID=A0A0E9R8X3_ANGAN
MHHCMAGYFSITHSQRFLTNVNPI